MAGGAGAAGRARRVSLAPADDAFAEALSGDLPEGTLVPAEARHNEEQRRLAVGAALWVARPRSTEEVARIVRHCAGAGVAVIPYGGGTGLVGGHVSDAPALLLSLERMDAVRAVRPLENVIEVEAGCVLADVQAAAEAAGRLFPLSLASEGSARIGGLMATNAGGTGVLRYGNMRDLVLGVEAVLPDGSVMRGAHRLRKANMGYDLRHLLIGAEGTLGVICAATLRLMPRPADMAAAMLAVPSPQAALELLSLARDRLGEAVSAFELIDGTGLRFVAETMPEVRQPLDGPPDWSVLIDVGVARGEAAGALEDVAAAGLEAGLVTDGVVGRSGRERAEFWALRESIPDANRRIGAVASHDISVPLSAIPEMVARGRADAARIADLRANVFGHVGDGNLHYNFYPAAGRTREDYAGIRAELTRAVHDLVHELGGAISAEHGIGRFKAADLVRYGDPAALAAMRAIKAALDPRGIMNPGAVLAPS